MTRWEARLAHAANLAVAGTGLVYGWMVYFAEPEDQFAVVNHPWQPEALHLHILFAPLLVFSCGQLWRDHIWRRVRSGFAARRKTGLVLFALVVPMILSGYLIQVAESELLRQSSIYVHVATSILWCLIYLVHQFSPKGRAARPEPRLSPEAGSAPAHDSQD